MTLFNLDLRMVFEVVSPASIGMEDLGGWGASLGGSGGGTDNRRFEYER